MKIDLINIYPGIFLETQKAVLGESIKGKDGWISRRYDKLVIDTQLKDYLKINNSIILSYKKIQIITLINKKGRVGKTTSKRLTNNTNYFL